MSGTHSRSSISSFYGAGQETAHIGGSSAALWDGTSWQAALLEARAHVAAAEGDVAAACALRRDARASLPL